MLNANGQTLHDVETGGGAISAARLARMPRAGHFVMLEQPDEVSRAIRKFLETLPASACSLPAPPMSAQPPTS